MMPSALAPKAALESLRVFALRTLNGPTLICLRPFNSLPRRGFHGRTVLAEIAGQLVAGRIEWAEINRRYRHGGGIAAGELL